MLEMSLEMRNPQYILGLVNGMLQLLSLSGLCGFSFLFYLFAQQQLLARELQHSLGVNCKC